MRILFRHQNFPEQFPHIATYLANSGHQVDPAFPNEQMDFLRIRTKNLINLLSLDGCDIGVSTTMAEIAISV